MEESQGATGQKTAPRRAPMLSEGESWGHEKKRRKEAFLPPRSPPKVVASFKGLHWRNKRGKAGEATSSNGARERLASRARGRKP